MSKIITNTVILFTIVIFAYLVRSINIHSFPPSLNWDEASLGYNAYSIFKTGRDEWSHTFPLIFRAFGDYKLPGYIYFSVPLYLTSFNPYLIRIPSIVAGIIIIISVYCLTYRLTKKSSVAIISSVILTVAPWSVFQSRIALEANLALAFFALGVAAYRKSPNISIFLLGLSALTYNTYRVLVPLFIVASFLTLRPKVNNRLLIQGIILFVCFVPIMLQLISGSGSARYRWVEILDSGAISHLENKRNTTSLPDHLKKVVYNRPVYVLTNITKNYLYHYSPLFLFINGGSQYQFNIPNYPLLYLFTLPFLLVGIFVWKNYPNSKPIYIWLLLAPLAASLTRDAPHALRASPLLIPLILFTGIGIEKVAKVFNSRILIYTFVLITLVFCSFDFISRWKSYAINYSWSWQYGHEQLVKLIKSNYENYDEFVITKGYGEPHIFFLYYSPINPINYISGPNLNRYFRTDWYWVDAFYKFKFVNDWELNNYTNSVTKSKRYLVISSPENPTSIGRRVSQINFLDGKPAFYINSFP